MLAQNYILATYHLYRLPEMDSFEFTPAEFLETAGTGASFERLGTLSGLSEQELAAGIARLWSARYTQRRVSPSLPLFAGLTCADFDRHLNASLKLGKPVCRLIYPLGGFNGWRFTVILSLDGLQQLRKDAPLKAGVLESAAARPSADFEEIRLIRSGADDWAKGISNLCALFDRIPDPPEEIEESALPYSVDDQKNMTLGEIHTLMKRMAEFLPEVTDKKNGGLSPHWYLSGGNTAVQRRLRGKRATVTFGGRTYEIGCYRTQAEPEPVCWSRFLGGARNSPAFLLR